MSTAFNTVLLQRLTVAASAALAFTAHAEGTDAHVMGQHPALVARAMTPTVDANHFIVQPPATTQWVRQHANGEHPAVLVTRQATHIDSNTFSVQPPATVTWTVMPDAAATLVARAR